MSYLLVQRLIGIRDEFDVAKASVSDLQRSWLRLQVEPDFDGIKLSQIQQATANLEATYIVRLFSVFESILRTVLPFPASALDRRNVYDLINKAASKWHTSVSVRDEAHRIREFRNRSVHQNNMAISVVSFAEALAGLNRFLAWLP